MKKYTHYLVLILLIALFSCNGIDDLIVNRTPVLSDMEISATQVAPYDTVYARITAENPIDGVLEYKWTVKNSLVGSVGTFVGPTDLDSVAWIAPYEGGTYTFKVKVSNTAKSADDTRDVEVVVSEKPFVNILNPTEGTYYIAGQSFELEAKAQHDNGLIWVRAYAGENLVGESSSTNASGIYTFTIQTSNSMVGSEAIRVEAKTQSVTEPGSDTIYIEVGGMVLGKE